MTLQRRQATSRVKCLGGSEAFDIEIGKCATIEDRFGIPLNILDMTKGPLKP